MNWRNTFFGYYFNAFRHGYGLENARRDFPKWRRLLTADRSSVSEELPWINFPAFDFLEKNLRLGQRVFEYGGGGSTLYFLKKLGPSGLVATVEHDENWMKILSENIAERGYKNWEGQFVGPEKLAEGEKANGLQPDGFGSNSPEFGAFSFKNYVKSIEKYADGSFDLVLVDGRSRVSCIAASMAKVKPNGFLVIDNADREYYLTPFRGVFASDFQVELDSFGPVLFHPNWAVTLVLRKI